MTCAPASTTTPAGSSPKIAGSLGSGRCGNHLVQLASTLPRFGTMPQALTSTSTSVEPGSGTGIDSIDIGAPTACMRAARIMAGTGMFLRLASNALEVRALDHRREFGRHWGSSRVGPACSPHGATSAFTRVFPTLWRRAIDHAPPTPEIASLHPRSMPGEAIHGPHGMEWQG